MADSTSADPLIGQILDGRYRVESHLGEGGMGAVYKAEHIAMAQPVAIKVLLTETANDPSMIKRFIREARSCFRIDHPNCVRVTDFGAAENGALYFAMEYLDGRTMGIDLHVDGAMSSARVRHVGSQVADALHHAHGLGLIHRDLKPGNIMLLQRDGDPDFVKVFDFGLGKLVDQGARLTGLTMSPLTQDGIVFGTPEYMSPEQATGQTLGPASDVYTLGVCCYEMLTEHLPFSGKTFTETLSKHVTEAPIPPSVRFPELTINRELEDLVMRCLDKEPAKRPTASALAAGLRSAGKEEPRATPVLASSETLLVSEASMASIAGAHLEPPEPSEALAFAQRRNPRILVGGGIAILLIAVGGLVLATRGGSSNAAAPADAGMIDAGPVLPRDASPPVDAAVELDAAAPPPIAPAKRTGRKPTKPKPKAEGKSQAEPAPEPDEHLRNAEKARRAGNILKQLSEANASLGVNPKGKRAAYLAGDALKRSGDKVAACKFFRRAGRQHYRAEGCSD